MTMTKQDRICMISLFAVMLVLMGVPALCLSTNTVVDELGTLTNTALLTGRNWGTGIISNGGFYYRYGMAFVWLLPFLIFKDPIMVYKAASFVNALFMATTPVMAYYISRRYLKIEKEKEAALLAAGSTIIGISIDNDIRTVSQAGIQPCHEPLCQSAVRPEIDYIVHAPVFRNLDGIVTAPVVDDQILNLIDPVDMFWQMIQCNFQRLCLVITWHLYN